MNKVMLMGRLTRDPEVRYSTGPNSDMKIGRFTIAVDRRRSGNSLDGQTADFINCVSFGNQADFIEKYLHKGTKIALSGRIQTGSYTNKDGQRIYTTDVIVDEIEFAESKNASGGNDNAGSFERRIPPVDSNGFMEIPEGIDEELPFT